MQKAMIRLALIWLLWIVGIVPLVNWLLPIGRASDFGEYVLIGALLAYFAAPLLLSAWLE
jgi:hypothetical protein